jgi:pimeloyl-ACP methyl ester carboxylesterase
VEQFWEGFNHVIIDVMPPALKEGFFKVNSDPKAFQTMFDKDVQRMKEFKGWSDEQMKAIKAPTLIMNGNQDVGSVEHAVEMHRIIPNNQLVILPGGHGEYIGTTESLPDGRWTNQFVVDIIQKFLN